MPGPSADTTGEQVQALLRLLQVEVVISVDDFWTLGAGDLEKIRDLLGGSEVFLAEVVRLLEAAEQIGVETDRASAKAVSNHLSLVWATLNPSLQQDLARAAAIQQTNLDDGVPAAQAEVELGTPARLKQLVGDAAVFIGIGFVDWRNQSAGVVADTRGTLVMFDRDFTSETGGAANTGETLMKDLLASARTGLRVGMLTRTVADEQEELTNSRDLADQFNVSHGSVVVIAKRRLEEETLPAALRVLLLADEIEAYVALARQALDQSHDRAMAALNGLQRYTIVGSMATAHGEGMYEADQPLRLLDRIQEETLIEVMRDPSFANNYLPRLRSAGFSSYLSSADAGRQIAEVLHADLFASPEFVSRLGLAIEIGDIFELRSVYPDTKARQVPPPRKYVLLAQSCDISMRPSGGREPEIHTFVLHEFREVPIDVNGKERGQFSRLHPVGRLNPASETTWGVNFGGRIAVPAMAIDATVFSEVGAGRIALDALDTRPMAESWRRRQDEIHRQARHMIDQQLAIESSLKKGGASDEVLLRTGASLAGASMSPKTGVTATLDTDKATVSFGIRRIGRVRSATALGLLGLANAYDSRPGFEVAVSAAGVTE